MGVTTIRRLANLFELLRARLWILLEIPIIPMDRNVTMRPPVCNRLCDTEGDGYGCYPLLNHDHYHDVAQHKSKYGGTVRTTI